MLGEASARRCNLGRNFKTNFQRIIRGNIIFYVIVYGANESQHRFPNHWILLNAIVAQPFFPHVHYRRIFIENVRRGEIFIAGTVNINSQIDGKNPICPQPPRRVWNAIITHGRTLRVCVQNIYNAGGGVLWKNVFPLLKNKTYNGISDRNYCYSNGGRRETPT